MICICCKRERRLLARGNCASCYAKHNKMVQDGLTTWAELLAAQKITPKRRGRPDESPASPKPDLQAEELAVYRGLLAAAETALGSIVRLGEKLNGCGSSAWDWWVARRSVQLAEAYGRAHGRPLLRPDAVEGPNRHPPTAPCHSLAGPGTKSRKKAREQGVPAGHAMAEEVR